VLAAGWNCRKNSVPTKIVSEDSNPLTYREVVHVKLWQKESRNLDGGPGRTNSFSQHLKKAASKVARSTLCRRNK